MMIIKQAISHLCGSEPADAVSHTLKPTHERVSFVLEGVVVDVGEQGVGRRLHTVRIVLQLLAWVQEPHRVDDLRRVRRDYLISKIHFLS